MNRYLKPRGARRPATAPLFAIRFVLYWLATLTFLALVPTIQVWAIGATLASQSWFYGFLHVEHSVAWPAMAVQGVSVRIVPDCTPIKPIAVLCAAMAAFPAAWRSKAIGFGLGGLLLWVFNTGRIAVLLLVLRVRPEWFSFIDAFLWQVVTLAAVLTFFVLWMRLVPSPKD